MRLLIYDDEMLFSEALAVLLERTGRHTVLHRSLRQELLECASTDADACLFNLKGADESIALLHDLKQILPGLPVIVIAEPEISLVRQSIESGADGICLKTDTFEEIDGLIARVAISSSPVWSRAALALTRRSVGEDRNGSLTYKERAVLEQLVHGASTSSIASSLGIGEATVRTHLQHLFTKFGVHSRLALVACAIRADAVDISGDSSSSRTA